MILTYIACSSSNPLLRLTVGVPGTSLSSLDTSFVECSTSTADNFSGKAKEAWWLLDVGRVGGVCGGGLGVWP